MVARAGFEPVTLIASTLPMRHHVLPTNPCSTSPSCNHVLCLKLQVCNFFVIFCMSRSLQQVCKLSAPYMKLSASDIKLSIFYMKTVCITHEDSLYCYIWKLCTTLENHLHFTSNCLHKTWKLFSSIIKIVCNTPQNCLLHIPKLSSSPMKKSLTHLKAVCTRAGSWHRRHRQLPRAPNFRGTNFRDKKYVFDNNTFLQ